MLYSNTTRCNTQYYHLTRYMLSFTIIRVFFLPTTHCALLHFLSLFHNLFGFAFTPKMNCNKDPLFRKLGPSFHVDKLQLSHHQKQTRLSCEPNSFGVKVSRVGFSAFMVKESLTETENSYFYKYFYKY